MKRPGHKRTAIPAKDVPEEAALRALTKDTTVIMTAHRLKTVRNSDRILVMDQGGIVERGTHTELVAKDGIYRRFTEIRESAENRRIQ